MVDDRKTRGRLSSLDLLPDEAQDDLIWALGQLNERRRSQADVLFELNDRLAVKGIDPISRSAFNRKSTRLAKRSMQLEERRHIYAGIAPRLTPEAISESDIVLGEFIKTLIDDVLEGENLDSKDAMQLARAHKDTIMAQAYSVEQRRKAEERARKEITKAVDDVAGAVEKVGVTVSAEDVLRMIRKAYGSDE